uniref:Chromosome 12 open reading frame 60 n=1 Tax=Aotus nancymaae TaxID=37293 RepID=A0A2K5BUT9_AOTNA
RKVKERLIQDAKMFFHVQDLASVTNTLTQLLNHNMNTQILLMAVKNNSRIFLSKYKIQKASLCSKVAMAMCSMVEKSTNVEELHQSAKEVFKSARTPVIISVLNSSNILGSLESSLLRLTKFPIMNLQLSDFYTEDTKEQSDVSTSKRSRSPGPSKTTMIDTLKKLQDALKTEDSKNPIESAADLLEQIVKAMGPILEILQKAIKAVEMNISVLKKASDK